VETIGHVIWNLIFLSGCLLGIPVLIAKYLDEAWLRDEEKRKLRARFESWWLTVVDYDRLKLALVCTRAFNRLTDVIFGEKLLSKKAFYRCSVLASGLLVASLAIAGLFNHQVLGVMPWVSYHESCKAVSNFADMIVGSGLPTNGKINKTDISFTATNSNSADLSSIITAIAFSPPNPNASRGEIHGEWMVAYHFYKWAGTNGMGETAAQFWSNNVVTMRKGVEKYDTTKNAAIYSAAFYLAL
jgi:hypothetical protein